MYQFLISYIYYNEIIYLQRVTSAYSNINITRTRVNVIHGNNFYRTIILLFCIFVLELKSTTYYKVNGCTNRETVFESNLKTSS